MAIDQEAMLTALTITYKLVYENPVPFVGML